ncbi:ribosome modulation factor [Methylorubrum zatmanii]
MDRDRTDEAAYAEGRHAAERSEGTEDNPHPPDSEAHRLWREGHASVTASDAVADDIGDFA